MKALEFTDSKDNELCLSLTETKSKQYPARLELHDCDLVDLSIRDINKLVLFLIGILIKNVHRN